MLSDEHENYIAKLLGRWNGRRSSSSGAMYNDPNDVTSDLHVIECKATEGQSITLKLDDWLKTRAKAYNGKSPAMAIRFKDFWSGQTVDLIIEEADEWVAKLEELEEKDGFKEST